MFVINIGLIVVSCQAKSLNILVPNILFIVHDDFVLYNRPV